MANIMDMSDDELSNLSDSQIEELIAAQEKEAEDNAEVEQEEDTPEQQEQEEPEGDPEKDEPEEDPKEDTPEGEADGAAKPEAAKAAVGAGKDPEAEPKKKDEPEPNKEKEAEVVERDYEAEVKKLLSPFKANGRQIQVDSVDDAIQLMQQGANYHKKMEALKPRLATLKKLEKEGLLDDDKLNHLIDLAKGNVGAINRLVKEHNVDTLSIDADKASEYRANQYSAHESEVMLDSVLEDLKDSAHYSQLLDTVGNKWDNASQQEIARNPEQLRDIHRHMELGVFDQVQDRVATERALGRLNGLSSFDAYRTVGERMHREGLFNGGRTATKPVPKVAAVTPAPKAQESDEDRKRKLAASPSGKKTVVKVVEEFDPLNMSDEDFLKQQAKFNIR